MASSRILPSTGNPYGSGGLLLDSTPYTQYHLQRQAQERAKEEALDNYFRNIDTKINSAGVRTQDIPDLIKQQNADREFYLQNKEAIKNPSIDNGKAYNEYMQRNQAKIAYVNQSKNEGEKYKQMVPVFSDPNKRALMTDEALGALELHDLPLNSPQRKSFDITQVDYNPKPFDQAKYQTGLKPFVKEVQGETTYTNAPDYATSFMRVPKIRINQNFDTDQVSSFAENEYRQNPSMRKLVSDISQNPYEYEKYNKIYKQAFGKEFDIQHPEQIASAYTISLMPKGYDKEGKPEIDQVAWEKFKNKRNFGQSLTKIAANKVGQGQQESNGNVLDTIGSLQKVDIPQQGTYIENGIAKAIKTGENLKGGVLKEVEGNKLPSDLFAILEKGGVKVSPSAKVDLYIGKNGEIVGVKTSKGLIDRNALNNFQLKYNTEPLKGKQMSFGKKTANNPLGLNL